MAVKRTEAVTRPTCASDRVWPNAAGPRSVTRDRRRSTPISRSIRDHIRRFARRAIGPTTTPSPVEEDGLGRSTIPCHTDRYQIHDPMGVPGRRGPVNRKRSTNDTPQALTSRASYFRCLAGASGAAAPVCTSPCAGLSPCRVISPRRD